MIRAIDHVCRSRFLQHTAPPSVFPFQHSVGYAGAWDGVPQGCTPEFVTWMCCRVGPLQGAHAADQENSKFSGLRAPDLTRVRTQVLTTGVPAEGCGREKPAPLRSPAQHG